MKMGKKGWYLLLLSFILLPGGLSSVSAATAPGVYSGFLGGFFSNALSAILKWLWSFFTTTKTVVSSRPVMKFESGYTVETVFDGSKVGIEPFAVGVLPTGELLVLDSANNNIYKISLPLSHYSRPKLIAGSPEGYSGHVDGKPREARLNHPKGFTVDDRGNIYIADTMNMAIRKISDTGVTTIAGGKWSRGGHVDGPSEDAKFSNDFEVVYVGSSCSLLVVDRGHQAIREIQLHFDDCAYQYGSGFPLGIAVLVAAGFFGYMLALLQRRVGVIVSSKTESETSGKQNVASGPYQKPLQSSVRPPLIPVNDETEKREGFFVSLGKLFINAGASVTEIFGGLFSGFRKKSRNNQQQDRYLQQQRPNSWPMQESFIIPDEDEPPSLETRTPTPRKTYAFMAKEPDKTHHFRLGRSYGWDNDFLQLQQQQQQQPPQQPYQKQQHHRRHYSSLPHAYYEQRGETGEIVFGAVQEQDGKQGAVEMKPVNHGDPMYDHHNIRMRVNSMGHSRGF